MISNYEQVDRRRVVIARAAVIALFFSNGTMLATWAARIPAVQARLQLPPGQLGIALLGAAIGALVAMNVAGRISIRFGSALITTLSAIGLCITLPLLAAAPNLIALSAALVFQGGFNGAMDVTMNLQGAAVEQQYGKPIFNSFHACFSVGALAGAFVGGIFASYNVEPLLHFGVIALLAMISVLIASRFLLSSSPVKKQGEEEAGPKKKAPLFVRPSRTLLALGAIAFCALISEGAMSDWSAIYLTGTAHSGAGLAAAGFAVFSLCMAIGRGVGDVFAVRFGPAALVCLGGLLAAIGLGLGLLFPWTPVVIVGLGLVGLGLAVLFPLVLSAAGRSSSGPAETALATVSTCGYVGFLVGPPMIGFLADGFGLRIGLCFVVLLCLITFLLGRTVGTTPVTKEIVIGTEETAPSYPEKV
ncbi:MFS transporter [Dictyobacter formicarum]|uniref:MFS transporter n=1 Tax=Dictyobacter formicarum TaxID=2778368 RepID=A0ABQ3VHG9_9CHLR|nr:MFS transporter [Dictyobacter formicarum]GHO84571.1 MFS transporter [Dictyobacter formicarum]